MIAALAGAALLGPAAAQQAPAPAPQATPYKSPFADPAWQGPANTLGAKSDAEVWKQIRQGAAGRVTIPDANAAVMIQTRNTDWRDWRNGPLAFWGKWALAGMLGMLALFFLVRGRIRIEAGPSPRRVLRFTLIERVAHWIAAGSFILLGLTGLNILYGRQALMPLIGQDAFATVAAAGKLIHNWVAWAFILGLAMILVLWTRDNLWDRYDWNWIRHGGGLLRKGDHPPAAKFNFGQKTMFWAVILGGGFVAVTGLNLLFPFAVTDLEGLQFAQLLHGAAALLLTTLMLAHIYIGSVGMEGAFDAMASGMVDENWAREHHSAWVEGRPPAAMPPPAPGRQPAE